MFPIIIAFSISICCIFQNDAKYLPEWIDFHKKQGVEHFYLYNNESTDAYRTILHHYIQNGDVTLIEWPYPSSNGSEWNSVQCSAYMHCIENHRGDEWIAFLDSDEFLFSPKFKILQDILKKFKKHPGVCVNWVMYGTSNVTHIDLDNERMLDKLKRRAVFSYQGNLHVKSIVQPSLVTGCPSPHFFTYKDGVKGVTENRAHNEYHLSKLHSVKKLRINHYWSRDMDFFYNVKLERRKKWGNSIQGDIDMEKCLNDVKDPILSGIEY